MYLVFIDGSGHTGHNLDTPTVPHYHLCAIAVHGRKARSLEDAASAVLEKAFGAASREPRFECKGSDLYRGEGPCRRMAPSDRVDLYRRLLALLADHDVHVFAQAVDKQALASRFSRSMHPHRLAFIYLVEQVERFLRGRDEFGLLISDEEKEVEQQCIEDLPRYKETGTGFGYEPLDLTRIVDNVHWVKSHDSTLLQLSDLCVYLCQRHARDAGRESANAAAIRALYREMEGQVVSNHVWPNAKTPRAAGASELAGAPPVRCPLPAAQDVSIAG
jgi:hypothetical protein